jgi:hypothetical protein
MLMDAPEVKRYSRGGTIALIVLAVVTMPLAMFLAIFLGVPWLCLAVYIVKRIWRSSDMVRSA